MAPPSKHRTREPVLGEPPEVRFLARADDYEIALLVPRSSTPWQPMELLVRLWFPGKQVEVVLTLAELAAFSTGLQRLEDYLQEERRPRPHQR